MKVLVTGNLGYVGMVMTPMLAAAGHEVVGLDSDLFKACVLNGESAGHVLQIRKDIRDVQRSDLEGCDAVIHLAALSNDPLGDLNPELTYEINHRASVRLALLAKDAGVQRFLFSSSCSTYGAAGDVMLTEEASFNPVTPYGHSKVLVEQDVSQLADGRFSPTFLRSTTAYGVSPKLRFDLVLNNLVAHAYATGRVFLKSDGTPWRPVIHIEDIARAFLAVLHGTREKVHNQAFNVGVNSENYQIRKIAEIVRETVPGSHIEYAPDAGPDKRCYRVDFGKICRALPEFSPRWNARLGAQQLYETYRRYDLLVDDFEGTRYQRISHLRYLLREGLVDGSLRWASVEVA